MKEILLKNKHLNTLTKDKPVVLALSGGVDSMVLFNLLLDCGFKVVIAHVNHHKRDESLIEEIYISNLAKELNCPFEVLHYYHEKDNFQSEAHQARYEFFYEVLKKYNASSIITAHHYQDNLETILMNIIKGSNIYGYAGIKEITNYNDALVIRPLLSANKSDIYKYAEENNIKYFEDSSNESDDYLRNRIRHHVIPLLESENPSLSSSVTNFSNQLFDAFSYIRNKSIDYVNKHNNKIEINSFINLALIEKKDIINYICDSHGILSSDNKINDILNLIDSNRPNLVYDLNKEYQFIKSYDICYISKKEIKQTIHHEIYPNEKVTVDGYGEFCFNEYTYDLINSISVSVNEPLPLVIRTRKNGDKLIIGDGHKKLKDFLIDKKVPLKERDKILLVENNNKEIIWVLGYYKKVCNEENSLKLTFKEKIR